MPIGTLVTLVDGTVPVAADFNNNFVMLNTTTIPVGSGGTGITSGTSGGVPYFSASTTIASSAALTLNGVVLGGGAGAAPTATAAGAANDVFRVPAAGGAPGFGPGVVTRVGGNTTEATTTSTTAVNVLTVSSLSIAQGAPVLIVASFRKTSGAAATVSIGLGINTTQVATPIAVASGTNQAENGTVVFILGAHPSSMLRAGVGFYANGIANTSGFIALDAADLPNGAITSVEIRGLVGNASVTLGIDDLHIYSLSTS